MFWANDSLILPPATPEGAAAVEVARGPNIRPFPQAEALPPSLRGRVLLKMEDNITTDHIMPSDSSLLPFRSNIPKLSEHCLTPVDPEFPARARLAGGGFLLAGHNYGQGSSREHAALVPLYLKIRGVLAKGFARIHRANLINNGILPLTFETEADYDRFAQEDEIALEGVRELISGGAEALPVRNVTKGFTVNVLLPLTDRQRKMILAGGLINMISRGEGL
jgi:aconitate hydratase